MNFFHTESKSKKKICGGEGGVGGGRWGLGGRVGG